MTDLDRVGEPVTRRPPIALTAAALVAALTAVLAIGAGWETAVAVGVAGAGLVTLGLLRGLPSALDVGAGLLFGGVVLAGADETVVEPTVVGTIATVVAWDLSHSAVALGEQLGREARTIRLEAVHVVSSLLIGLLSGTIGYGVYVVAGGGQPVAAAVLLLLAAVLLTVGLGSRRNRSSGRNRRRARGP